VKGESQFPLGYLSIYILFFMAASVIIGLWASGLFSIGERAPQITGFFILKPEAGDCQLVEGVLGDPAKKGLSCSFMNNAENTIRLRNVSIVIDGEACEVTEVRSGDGIYSWACESSRPESCSEVECVEIRGGEQANCTGNGLGLMQREKFTVHAYSTKEFHNLNPSEPCYTIKSGGERTAQIDIAYDTTVLDITLSKHSSGTLKI